MTTTDLKNNLTHFAEVAEASACFVQPERRRAWDLVVSKGFPTAKTEEYRFTPVVRTLESLPTLALASSEAPNQSLDFAPGLEMNRLVFINGSYSESQSNIIDQSIKVTLKSGGSASPEADVFDLLNQVFAGDMIHIDVPPGQKLERPIAIVYVQPAGGASMTHPRWSLTLGEGSHATLLEYSVSGTSSAWFNNKVSTIDVSNGATLSFVMVQDSNRDGVFINNSTVRLGTASRVNCYTCTFSGKLVRNNLTLQLEGERIDANLHGLYMAFGKSLIDNHTVVDHRKPNSYSNELYKGVLNDEGKAVFNGKIFVRPDAQKTNAFQSNRNILLSEGSTIHTKPQLEIWADDVKCSHGCTTGQLDEEALFYLRSRGIPKDEARGLLLNAFAAETLEGIPDIDIRTFVEELILKKLRPGQQ
jgi:Fe-S cluster assembly protein SufD